MLKTVQGINLESETSIVKISLEGNNIGDITELIEKVASFHKIFIYEYTISPTLLTITSKLPFLWRDASEVLNKLSKQEITIKEADLYIVEILIKKRLKSMSTISLLDACAKKNIEITPSIIEQTDPLKADEDIETGSNRYYTLGCGKGSHITCSASSTKDAHIAQKIQRDKWATNIFIQRMQLPLPKWDLVNSKSHLEDIWSSYKKPVVIKPTGLTAGKGVSVGISTLERAKEAFDDAKSQVDNKIRNSWQKKIMIQEQVEGEDYRLLVIGGRLQVATKRIPAFVVGDGKSNIKELIEKENSDPRRDTRNPAHILKPIKIDKPLIQYLKDQNLTLDSVPQKEERVPVRKVASMSQGGITQDFSDDVSKEIKATVESIASSMHSFTLGVDVMCKDISKPLTRENGAILEVNTMPEMYLNLYPVLGERRDYVADIYIDELLKENTCKRFVVIGQNKDDIATILRKKSIIKKDQNIGEIMDNRYIIDGMQIISELDKWRAISAIKCNSLLDAIIIHHRDWNDVKEYGLGFDYIDSLFITKEMSNDKEEMKIMKRYKRKKLINNIKIIK